LRKACTTDELKAIWASKGAEFGALTRSSSAALSAPKSSAGLQVVKASGAKLD
jgi:hypothetical protein